METTLIYSVPFGCSFAAIAALEWSGLPYRLARVEARDPASKQHPAFLAINPLSQTPALLTHAGAPLLESMAILLHLAARAPHKGLGFAQGTPAYDRLNSVLSFLHTTFHAAFMPAFQASRAAPDDARAAIWREMATEKVNKSLAHLERLLAGRAWLASETAPSIADAYLAATARWAEPLIIRTWHACWPRWNKTPASALPTPSKTACRPPARAASWATWHSTNWHCQPANRRSTTAAGAPLLL